MITIQHSQPHQSLWAAGRGAPRAAPGSTAAPSPRRTPCAGDARRGTDAF